MMSSTVTALLIFVAAYALIVSGKVHRTIVGIVGAMLMVLFGIIDQETAIRHIDFNTLGLLMGMMIIVNVTSETGLFKFLAIGAAKKVHAHPIKLLVALSTLTAICSALLDNVTTVLLTVPITFSITQQLKVNVKPFLIAQILSANIGGTATLIGDPPNIMIASAVGLSFMDFIINLTAPAVVIFLITNALIILIYRADLNTQPELQDKVMRLSSRSKIVDPKLLSKCIAALMLTFALFILHRLGLETATAALTGAGFLLLMTARRDDAMIAKMLDRIEWVVIFFFAGLFVLVGALVETGVIKILATKLLALTDGSVSTAAILILWMSAIASAFIDNIPFVATLIPLIKDMGTMGLPNLEPMWWSLALGACLGGNGTLLGASANVVVASLAKEKGKALGFAEFMKIAFPMMLLSIIIATVYVYWRYL